MKKDIFCFCFFLLACFELFSNEFLNDFHDALAGIWDTEENLIDEGYIGKRSWGETNKSISSILVIDLLWKEGNQIYNNRIFFSNDTYIIKECFFINDFSFVVLLEATTKRRESQESIGYYYLAINDEKNELSIKHIDNTNSSDFNIDFSPKYLDSKLISWEEYSGHTLFKRSGPDFSYNDGD